MPSASEFYRGKVAIITGAASGIGFALANTLAGYQCHVVMTDIDSIPALPHSSANSETWTRQLDVQNQEAVAELIREVTEHFQRLDLMFNNAGVAVGGPAFETELCEWHKTINTNVLGVINGSHCAYQYMLKQGFGHIINTSSVVGILPNVLAPAYTTSKVAVAAYSLQLQLEASAFGIKVHTLLPGAVDTPILVGGNHGRPPLGISKEKLQRYWKRHHPISSGQFALSALDAIAKGKTWIILPSRWRYLPILGRYIPGLWLWHSKKLIRKQTWFKQIFAMNHTQ